MTRPFAPPPAPRDRPLMLVVDGSYAIFRAFFAIKNMRGPAGEPTGAIYGLVRQVRALLDTHHPDYFAVAFDETDTGFRAEIDPTYKANRGETPPELAAQWPLARALLAEMGLCTLAHARWEADDLLAALASHGRARGVDVIVSSGDKDLGQVVVDGAPSVRQHDPLKDVLLDEAAVIARWGVRPAQIPSVQALAGDSVDNISGVPGIGLKTAAKLIAAHGDLAGLYAAVDTVYPPRIAGLLRDHREAAERALRLVVLADQIELETIVDCARDAAAASAPIAVDGGDDLACLRPRRIAAVALAERMGAFGFRGLQREVAAWVGAGAGG